MQQRSVSRGRFALAYLLFVSLAVITPLVVSLLVPHSLLTPEAVLVGVGHGVTGAVAYRRKHPTVAAALGCGALTAAALYCLYWVVAVALFLHEGLDLPSQ